jgi:hypothetical protein
VWVQSCLTGGDMLTLPKITSCISPLGPRRWPTTNPTSISSRAGRFVPVLEHLSECSRPFRHAGCNKAVKLFLGRSPASPSTRLGRQCTCMLRNEVPDARISIENDPDSSDSECGSYSFSIFTSTNQQ